MTKLEELARAAADINELDYDKYPAQSDAIVLAVLESRARGW